jgi:hypothetical protein
MATSDSGFIINFIVLKLALALLIGAFDTFNILPFGAVISTSVLSTTAGSNNSSSFLKAGTKDSLFGQHAIFMIFASYPDLHNDSNIQPCIKRLNQRPCFGITDSLTSTSSQEMATILGEKRHP